MSEDKEALSKMKSDARMERQKMVPELRLELDETFSLLADGRKAFPADKLPLALKVLGMEANQASLDRAALQKDISFDEWILLVVPYLSEPEWILAEMTEAMTLFDQDNNGSLDASEVTQVFVKIGEKINKSAVQDQINAWSRTDGLVGVGEFFQMVLDRESIPIDESHTS